MSKFLFWLIRFFCITFFLSSFVIIDIHDFASFIFHLVGWFAAINIYLMGLISCERNKSLPTFFIYLRIIQFIIFLTTDSIYYLILVIYISLDVVVFTLFIIDLRYDFVLKELGVKNTKTTVVREDIVEEKTKLIKEEKHKLPKGAKQDVTNKTEFKRIKL